MNARGKEIANKTIKQRKSKPEKTRGTNIT
jgi:hypothetical protein